MPRGFSDHEKELIRTRLLELGHKHFTNYGLKKTSIDEIAAAAGISKGAFYLFYDSKEAFFMDVVERVEEEFRVQVLAEIDRPGESPRARLTFVLKKAFTLWKTVPILQVFTRSEYEVLARRLPPDQLDAHIRSDRIFLEELVQRCYQSGIQITVKIEQVTQLMYILFFASLHVSDFGEGGLSSSIDILIEIIAAYFLGEIRIQDHSILKKLEEQVEEK